MIPPPCGVGASLLHLNMPTWSYIPYSSLSSPSSPDAAFHPALWRAAFQRIRPILFRRFGAVSLKRLHFLQRLLEGVLSHPKSRTAYQVVLDAFDTPLFCLQNLAHTLEDPQERMVYVIHLEDALHVWLTQKEEAWCWESLVIVGIAGLLGIGLAYMVTQSVPPCNWCTTQGSPLLHLFGTSLA